MSADILNDPVTQLLGKALDAYSLRHKVIANNIANVNTPGFKRSYVPFEETLNGIVGESFFDDIGRTGSALRTRSEIGDIHPEAVVDSATSRSQDGNNVNIDQEMAELARNGLSYNIASDLLKKRIYMLRYVVSDGRR